MNQRNDATDFFEKQDAVFALTQKVLRLCGEDAYARLPNMANADSLEDLQVVEDAANNALRRRRNQMARAYRRAKSPPVRGQWTHRQLFTRWLRECPPSARSSDRAWKDYLSENEIMRCQECGGYSLAENSVLAWWKNGAELLAWCNDSCFEKFYRKAAPEDRAQIDAPWIPND